MSVTYDRSVIFSGYFGFLCHDITEILLKVTLNTNYQNHLFTIQLPVSPYCLQRTKWLVMSKWYAYFLFWPFLLHWPGTSCLHIREITLVMYIILESKWKYSNSLLNQIPLSRGQRTKWKEVCNSIKYLFIRNRGKTERCEI